MVTIVSLRPIGAMVEFGEDAAQRVRYPRQPFQREPDFGEPA